MFLYDRVRDSKPTPIYTDRMNERKKRTVSSTNDNGLYFLDLDECLVEISA